MKKKGTVGKQNKKHGISHERLNGMTISMVSHALWALLIAVVVFVGILGAQRVYTFGYQVFTNEERQVESRQLEITIGEHTSTLSIGRQLEKGGIIDDAYVFFAQSLIFDLEVQPGTYVIDVKSTSRELLEQFNKGPENTT